MLRDLQNSGAQVYAVENEHALLSLPGSSALHHYTTTTLHTPVVRSFANISAFHTTFVSGIKPYSCRSCGISFSARSRFAVHLSKYHKMSIRDHRSISEFLASFGGD
ncbi:unnamed protein product [Angiostrongylus costaricensis]|uniref:C2H2-type domain-containing protein n=1 Tax=Angiostrongylus costaricensis TaxID=334426 RepID=A0A0R3PBN0_ANGCS|nr:unnamed protein product [Angiostrongylus costaricensis]